jgi:long-chain acyl-CoA synthetase
MESQRYPVVRSGKGISTIIELLRRSSQDFGPNIAVTIRDGKSWRSFTYAQLLTNTQKLAGFLKSEFKIGKGDCVSILSENRPEWAVAYLAILWTGATVVPLDPRLSLHEKKHILTEARVKALIFSGKFKSEIEEFKLNLSKLCHLCLDKSNEARDLTEIGNKTREIAEAEVNPDDIAVILYTSGTTGTAKGVILTHQNIASNVDAVYQCFDFGPKDRFFSVLPLHHVFEATAGFLAPIHAGSTIVYARSLKSNEIKEDMLESKPTVLLAVPLLLEKVLQGIQRELRKSPFIKKTLATLLQTTSSFLNPLTGKRAGQFLCKPIRQKAGFGQIRYIISGGAALPKWVAKGLENLGFPIFQGYGLSEAAPVLTCNPPQRAKNETVGLPIPGVEIRIIRPNKDGIGEIAAKGANIMPGYYKNPQATQEVITPDGWLLTGDLGKIDPDGYLTITGRRKSVIITTGGKNIYPEEVEEVLLESPLIEEVLVLASQNPQKGETVEAIVFPNYEAVDVYFRAKNINNPSEKEVYALIKEEIRKYSLKLADYKRPTHFTIREEEFPKTTTKKIKRYLFEKVPSALD